MEQQLPGRVQRRLAAILAADVAGYSRLMGLDEVGTVRTLGEHRVVADALVAKHGGRIAKTRATACCLSFLRSSMRSNAQWPCRRVLPSATMMSLRTSVCCFGSGSALGTS